MPSRAERIAVQEEQGKINSEASGLINRFDRRLVRTTGAYPVIIDAWLRGMDSTGFTIEKDTPEGFVTNSFRIGRKVTLRRSGFAVTERRLEVVSTSGDTETTRRLVAIKSSEPSPESDIVYFRRKKVKGKVVESLPLRKLKAVHNAAQLIDDIPIG